MKQILFTVLKGEKVLFTKILNLKSESLSCSIIKIIVGEILNSLDINSKKIFAIIRHCIFKIIRIIIATKSYEDWSNGKKYTCDYKGVYVTAKFINSTKP